MKKTVATDDDSRCLLQPASRYGSIQREDESTKSIKSTKRRNSLLHVAARICCVSTVVSGLIIAGILLSVSSYHRSKTTSVKAVIGDSVSRYSTDLFTVNNTIATVSLKLLNPISSNKLSITLSSNKTPKYQRSLPSVTIPLLSGRARFNYNYYSGDTPIYLVAGSSITYHLNITSNGSSDCSAQLYLFDEEFQYTQFKNYAASYDALTVSPCFTAAANSHTFLVNRTASYYVAIGIGKDQLVSSNVSVLQQRYNTTGLGESQELSLKATSCQVNTCGSFYCQRSSNIYLLAVSSGYAQVNMEYTTAHIYRKSGMVQFVIGIFLVLLSLLLIIIYVTKVIILSV